MDSGECAHFVVWYNNKEFLTSSNLFFLISTGISILPMIFLNVLTLATIWRKQSFHSPAHIFICNLALSDLAVAVLAIPLTMAWRIAEMSNEKPSVVCALAYGVSFAGSSTGTSFITLTAATIDRYLALRYHLHYPLKVTTRRVIAVCILSWVLPLLTGACFLYNIILFDTMLLTCMVPSMISIVVCYYKIYSIVYHHHNQIQAQVTSPGQQAALPNMSRFKKSVSVIVYMLVAFFVLYAPFLAVAVYHKFKGYDLFYLHAWIISAALSYLNSVVNPVLYCWRLKEFRIAMIDTFYSFFKTDKVVQLS